MATKSPRLPRPRQKVLSKKDRDALYDYAKRTAEADPATEAPFVAAKAEEVRLNGLVTAMLKRNIEELFNPADMAVLAKYGRTDRMRRVRVQLKGEALSAHDRGVSYGGEHWEFDYDPNTQDYDGPVIPDFGSPPSNMPYEQRLEWRAQFPSVQTILITGEDEKLFQQWKLAKENAELTSSAREQSRSDLLQAYRALVDASRTFEQVVEVWPGASALRDQIAPQNTAVSLLSKDALLLIKKDVARHAAHAAEATPATT